MIGKHFFKYKLQLTFDTREIWYYPINFNAPCAYICLS